MTTQAEKLPTLARFVAFYSYKGGVGRTLALANSARTLTASGKKVVLLDFDLEAPGLQHFEAFQPKNAEKKPAGFAEYLETCLQDGPPDELDGYIQECRGKKGDQGKTWLMPAGRYGEPGYLAFLNHTTWSDFYTRQDGYKILENLRGHIIECYDPDYVFIDARTGLSEIGGIATHQLADIVVLVFN
ncbi:MAG: tyrosine-protein kinase family protein, partial [Methylobacter sp.]